MPKESTLKFKMYDDSITLTFDEKSHVYSVDGTQILGVTSVVGVLDKPALMYWASGEVVKFYRNAITPGESYSEVQLEAMHSDAKYCFRKKSDEAKFIGQVVHRWIEDFINAGLRGGELPKRPIDQNINSSLDAFLKWTRDEKIKFKLSEQKVFSKLHEFAGTLDAEGDSEHGLTIIDFKTSSGIYDEYWFQVAAYLFAREEETGNKYAGGYIVRIDKTTGEFEVKYKTREDLEPYYTNVFLPCLSIYKWQIEQKNKK